MLRWGCKDEPSSACATVSPESIYVHIPFCAHRCGYCNFAVTADRRDMIDEYLDALAIELSLVVDRPPISTIFIGGGTPTELSFDQFDRLKLMLDQAFDLSGVEEWTIEANPNNINQEICKHLQALGVNRLSIGVQSFNDEKLRSLDRNHDSNSSSMAIELASSFFKNISIDLIFAAPNESRTIWKDDLRRASSLPIQHLSTYGLTIEKGTQFWNASHKQTLSRPLEEDELWMYETAIEYLAQHGFDHYEVSNFSKPNHVCRHNMAYWDLKGWWAFGAGAARAIGRSRSTNHASTRQYIRLLQRKRLPLWEHVVLSDFDWTLDRFIFGMRTRRGVPVEYINEIGDKKAIQYFEGQLTKFSELGLVESVCGFIRLTPSGLVLSDSIWASIYAGVRQAGIEG